MLDFCQVLLTDAHLTRELVRARIQARKSAIQSALHYLFTSFIGRVVWACRFLKAFMRRHVIAKWYACAGGGNVRMYCPEPARGLLPVYMESSERPEGA